MAHSLSCTGMLQACHTASPTNLKKRSICPFANQNLTPEIHLRGLNSPFEANFGSRSCRFWALSPGRPPPPESEPPPKGKSSGATIARLQETTQIFLAVLFWMTLFFWHSTWDGKDNGGRRPRKGSWFRR